MGVDPTVGAFSVIVKPMDHFTALSQTYLCLHPQQLTSHKQFSQHCAILGWAGLNMAEIKFTNSQKTVSLFV